jgi:hypothetical protein
MDWSLAGVAVHLLKYWRIVIAVSGALLVAWLISKAVDFNTAYLSYTMLVGSFFVGIAWEINARRKRRQANQPDIQA